MGRIEYSFRLIGVGKGLWDFKNTSGDMPF